MARTAPPQFELTDALAELIGLTGVQRIRWSYTAKRSDRLQCRACPTSFARPRAM